MKMKKHLLGSVIVLLIFCMTFACTDVYAAKKRIRYRQQRI